MKELENTKFDQAVHADEWFQKLETARTQAKLDTPLKPSSD